MDKVMTVLQVVAPIFFAMLLGILARKRKGLSPEEVQGMQRFVVRYCLPCLIFNSCLNADVTPQVLSSMALLPPLLIVSTLWAFRARKNKFLYFNFPHLFSCKETGMMGIPLFMILFGADQAYRMGMLDLAQAVTAYPVLALLTAGPNSDASAKAVIKQMLTSPLIILSLLGITLNLTGIWDMVEAIGVGGVVTESVSFLGQPVSAVMLFCVGYNFNLSGESRGEVFKITALHVAVFAVFGVIVQLALLLIPNVDALTRWAMLMYCTLPASYLAPSLGRRQEESVMASGVCSITTVLCLAVFCVMAAITA